MEVAMIVSIVIGILTVIAIIALYFLKRPEKDTKGPEEPAGNKDKNQDSNGSQTKFSSSKVKSKGKYQPQKKKNILLEPHPYLAANFKGHIDTILLMSFEPGGKYLATLTKDCTVRLWNMKTINDKEKKCVSCNFSSYEIASCMVYSPDGKAILVANSSTDEVVVLRITKNGSHVSMTIGTRFSLKSKGSEHVSLGIAPNGSFIMMCNEISFSLFKIKGEEELVRVVTNMSPNTCAVVSPCSKYVACAGFTTSVKIYEVEFSKDGEFRMVSSVMSLNGHTASVVSLQFSTDSKRVVTVSNDKTCRIWDIDVQYRLQEPTRCLIVISIDTTYPPCCVALSPNGLVLGVAIHTSVWVYSSTFGTLQYQFDNIHNEPITNILWDPSSLYLVTAGGDDRYVRVWHNVPGMKQQIKNDKEEMRSAKSEALKDRLRKDIDNISKRLQEIEEKSIQK